MNKRRKGPRPPSRRSTRESGGATHASLPEALAAVLQLVQGGHGPQALEACRQLVQQHPGQAEPAHLLGRLLVQAGQIEAAEESLRTAVRLAPDYAEAWNDLGNVYSERGHWREAEAAYTQALANTPDLAMAHNNLGLVYQHQGQLEAAIAAFGRVLQLRPEDADAWHNLGAVLKKLGRYEESGAAFRRVIELAPQHAEAHQNLCGALRSAGRTEEARAALRAWIQLEPANPVPQHMLASLGGDAVPSRASDGYVRNVFDRFAETFDQQLTQLQYHGPDLIAAALNEHLGSPRGDLLVLDAGCGTGLCGPALRPYARQLTGIDLSSRMLDQARQRQLYDALESAELTSYLHAHLAGWDVIIACDTFNYFGDLETLLSAVARALRLGGTLIFTLEHDATIASGPGFRLNPTGRYSHAQDYLRSVLEATSLALHSLLPVTLRLEAEQPVAGLLVTATAFWADSTTSIGPASVIHKPVRPDACDSG
ncbi:MAG: tetratricopeptide repeat protein [Planctomycetota bacterium]|nr:tetratricopeptide repeat protein [Planctomycetota bacterium]